MWEMCCFGDFVDVQEDGHWTEGYLIEAGSEFACVVTLSQELGSVPVSHTAPFRTKTTRSCFDSCFHQMLVGLVDFQDKIRNRLPKSFNENETVQLFAGLLPLGLAIENNSTHGNLVCSTYSRALIEYFKRLPQLSQSCVKRTWPSVWAAELLSLGLQTCPLFDELLAAHISALASESCPLCALATFAHLSHYFTMSAKQWNFYDEGTPRLAVLVKRSEYVSAAAAAVRYYTRALKVEEALETFLLMLQANEEVALVSPQFVTECLGAMSIFIKLLPADQQKAEVIAQVLSPLYSPSYISFEDLCSYNLVDSHTCRYFFGSMPIASCIALIELATKSRIKRLVSTCLPEFPSECCDSLRKLLCRARKKEQERLCKVLWNNKVLWAVADIKVAKCMCTRLETLGVLWTKRKAWLARLSNNLVFEVIAYLK